MNPDDLAYSSRQRYIFPEGDIDLTSEIFQVKVASYYREFQAQTAIARQALEGLVPQSQELFSSFFLSARSLRSAAASTSILYDENSDSDRFLTRGIFLGASDILLQASRLYSVHEIPEFSNRLNTHGVLMARAEESFGWIVEDLEWRTVPRVIPLTDAEIAAELKRSEAIRSLIAKECSVYSIDNEGLQRAHFNLLGTIQSYLEFAVSIPLPDGFDPDDFLMSEEPFKGISIYRNVSPDDFVEPRKKAIVELCKSFWLLAEVNLRLSLRQFG